MILLDDRIGSNHLVPLIRDLGGEAEVTRLEFGDATFMGNGPNGPIAVGVEFKKPSDLVTSIATKRLTGRQIPGMLKCYDETYLAIVGRVIRTDGGGISEVRYGRATKIPTSLSWDTLEAMKMSFRHQQHITIVEVENDSHLAAWLVAASHWWSRPWDSHVSHVKTAVIYNADKELVPSPMYDEAHVAQVAKLIPDIGIVSARRISMMYDNVCEMAASPLSNWYKIKGMSKKKAAQAYLWFRTKR